MQNVSYSKDIYEINHPDCLGKKGFFDTKNNDVKIWEMQGENGQRIFRVDVEPKKDNAESGKIQESIKVILDFVERWNKSDKERKVAEAQGILEEYLEKK